MAASVNKNRTAQQIRADRNFQKQIEEHVKISGRRIIVLSLEDNKVAKLGEESLVRLAVERMGMGVWGNLRVEHVDKITNAKNTNMAFDMSNLQPLYHCRR